MASRWAKAWVAGSGGSARAHPRAPTPSARRLATASMRDRRGGTEYSRRLSIMHMATSSVGEPQQQIPGVVIGSVTPHAVIVAAAAVELVVADVLRADFGIEPGQVVHLRDPAAGVGRAVGARYGPRVTRCGHPAGSPYRRSAG